MKPLLELLLRIEVVLATCEIANGELAVKSFYTHGNVSKTIPYVSKTLVFVNDLKFRIEKN